MRKQKTPRKKLIEKLDALTREIVKTRDRNICQKSGELVAGSNCHWSHVIPVSAGHALRWHPWNSMVLSYHSHINWWHKNPMASSEWFKQKFPERWAFLEIEAAKPKVPIKDWELENQYQELLKNKEKWIHNEFTDWE